ncbi:MAG: efflux RND transporter periplasmic adaptor subunit [Amphritea sp.]
MKLIQRLSPALLSISFLAASPLSLAADDAAAPQGLPAEVVHVQSKQLIHSIEAVGSLRANESIILRPEQSGKVEKILFGEGTTVNTNDNLFVLDASIYEAELNQAQARVSLSLIAFKRAESLLKKRVGSQQNKDSALAQLRVDQAQEALAQTRLDKMTISAPYTGIIGLRQVSPGDYVNVGQDLVELTDISTMKVEFRIPENYLTNLFTGQTISVKIDALAGKVFSGKIYAISPSIDDRGHNIAVRAEIPNRDNQLRPGLFAKIEVITQTEPNALMIPEEAIIPQNNSFFVLKVVDNKVEMVPVEMGIRRGAEVNILNGLAQGDVVVTAGQIKLFPGMPITPIFVDGTAQLKPATADAAAQPGA